MLSENGKLILKNKEIASTFNDHIGHIVDNLDLDHWNDHFLSPSIGFDRIDNIIKRYKTRPSIKNIKSKFKSFRSFSFQPVFMVFIVLLIGNKGRKLVHLLVHGVILLQVYHKDQSLVLFFLIFS